MSNTRLQASFPPSLPALRLGGAIVA